MVTARKVYKEILYKEILDMPIPERTLSLPLVEVGRTLLPIS